MSVQRLYRLAQRSIVTTADAAAWELIAPSDQKIKLLELSVKQVTAVAGIYGIGKPQAKGVTPTSPVVFVADRQNSDAAVTAGAVAWGTPPTVPAKFLYRSACPNTIGAGFDLNFDDDNEEGIDILAGESLVVWILATAPVLDITALIKE